MKLMSRLLCHLSYAAASVTEQKINRHTKGESRERQPSIGSRAGSGQRRERGACLHVVGCLETLREPAVNFAEELACGLAPALTLPQTAQSRRHTELP